MKLIITEEQLRILVESEKEENLIDFTTIYESEISPDKWDSMFMQMNKKKGGKYDGYYIDGEVDLSVYDDITELEYLVRVGGDFTLGDLINSLPRLSEVGGNMFLNVPFSKIYRKMGEKELRKKIDIGEDIYLKRIDNYYHLP